MRERVAWHGAQGMTDSPRGCPMAAMSLGVGLVALDSACGNETLRPIPAIITFTRRNTLQPETSVDILWMSDAPGSTGPNGLQSIYSGDVSPMAPVSLSDFTLDTIAVKFEAGQLPQAGAVVSCCYFVQ